MLSSVMIIMLATLDGVLADDRPTYCLTTKRVKDQANFTVQPERCADGVKHCLITLSVTNDTTGYVRHNFHCWPWPELQSSCPAEHGVCQLLHISDDQLHRTCCCRGSMCNNATLAYLPLQNTSALYSELRTRLETFGLRDPTGQLLPVHVAHLSPASVRSAFRDWFEAQSTRLVLACLAVLLACLSVGLVALVHYCPTTTTTTTTTPSSSESLSTPRSFLLACRTRFPFLTSQRHQLRRNKSRSMIAATTHRFPLIKRCSIPCICPSGRTGRARDPSLSVSPPPHVPLTSPISYTKKSSHGGRHPLVVLNARHKPDYENDGETATADLLRFERTTAAYPEHRGDCSPQSTGELELMQGIADSSELLRFLGHGRFAEVWLATLPVSRSSSLSKQLTDQLNNQAHRHAIDSFIPVNHNHEVERNSPNTGGQPSSQSDPLVIAAHRSCSLINQLDGDKDSPLPVAVKIFPASEQRAWATEFAVFRALRAANPTSDDQSPDSRYNLIHMFGAGKVETDYRIVLEFASNGSLRNFLDRGQWLQFHTVVNLSRDLARGLSYLHADCPHGSKPCIAHRDLKPENVLIRADGSACLSDFGQAVLLSPTAIAAEDTTSTRVTMGTKTPTAIPNATDFVSNLDAVPKAGTLRYMAPEILDGAIQFDARSILYTDMYSLSLCLWELLNAVPDASLNRTFTTTTTYPEPTTGRDPLSADPATFAFRSLDSAEQSPGPSRRVWLPYEQELGRDCSSPQAMRHWVSGLKRRPTVNSAWITTPLIAQFYRSISECWDSEPEARLSATCVLERLNAIHAQLSNTKCA